MRRTDSEIRALLTKNHIKVTPQRIAVYKSLQELGHADAEQIAAGVHADFPTVTVGTIYNVLDCFWQAGLITKLNTSDNKMFFDIGVHDHHHMICEQTGEIADFGDAELTAMIRRYYEQTGHPDFRLENIRVQFIGHFTERS